MSKKIVKRVLKWTLIPLGTVAGILLIGAVVMTGLYLSADMMEPDIDTEIPGFQTTGGGDHASCGGNYLRRSESGLWEAYIHGDPAGRGKALGAMSDSLLYYQEMVFVDQIRRIVPSDSYLKFLRFFLVAFNRNLGKNVPQEFREEIAGISLSCTHEFDAIGTPYERQLNYHAAHDIGHMMQEYMLVGCSSFAAWDSASADSALVVGRNFDFWVGDEFADNKMVLFCSPDEGHRFASVCWPGMMGVLSGMNEKGLTVTINAAKGAIPTSSAMPISLLAREILQYASTIEEAFDIAKGRRTFVSESLLIGSGAENRAAVIEKTPKETALYESRADRLICTNHFQSGAFAGDKRNIENIETSDSPYRWARIEELMDEQYPRMDEHAAAAILRDRLGAGGKDIGLTNEMSLNQSIAHHSVIFKPGEGLMWVSTGPWQSGRYVCYDIGRIFSSPDFAGEIQTPEFAIAADSLFMAHDYQRVLTQREETRKIKEAIKHGELPREAVIAEYIANNPEYYYVWTVAADYYLAAGDKARAKECLQTALTKEIPQTRLRGYIEKDLKKLK